MLEDVIMCKKNSFAHTAELHDKLGYDHIISNIVFATFASI